MRTPAKRCVISFNFWRRKLRRARAFGGVSNGVKGTKVTAFARCLRFGSQSCIKFDLSASRLPFNECVLDPIRLLLDDKVTLCACVLQGWAKFVLKFDHVFGQQST